MTIVPDDEPTTIVPDEPSSDRLHNVAEGAMAHTQGVVRGIPIIGPMLDRGVNAVVAAPAALIPGTSWRKAYDDLNAMGDRIAAEHPVESATGEVAGSVMSTVPAARLFPKAFGGSTFAGQTAAGGALGGTDAFIRSGGDPGAAKTGAAIGAAGPLMGQILAPLGQGLVSAGRAVKDYFPGVSKVLQPRILPAPTAEIEQAAERGYQSLSTIAPYERASLNDLTDLIKRDLHAQSKSGQIGATETHRILDTLDSLPPTASSLHTIRKELNKVTGGDEGYSARYARQMIDHFLENPPPTAVTGGQAAAARAGPTLQEANANYQAAMQSTDLRDRIAKAKLDAAGSSNLLPFLAEGQATRKQMRQWASSDKQSRFLTEPQREAVEDIGKGSLGERALQGVSAVTGMSRPGAFTAVLPMLTWGTSGLGHAAALAGAGAGASAATTALTRRAVNEADNVIRASAPYSQAYMAGQLPPRLSMSPPVSQMPASISAGAHRDEIARLLALQTEREATPGPRRIIIDTPSSVEEQR
jgi:hypothetical protein